MLGESKVGALPSDFAQPDVINAPLKWMSYFMDTVTLDENDEREDALSDLDEADFASTFIAKLKSGKLDTIDWDKELVVPILKKLLNKGEVKAMELEEILGNPDRFAQYQGERLTAPPLYATPSGSPALREA